MNAAEALAVVRPFATETRTLQNGDLVLEQNAIPGCVLFVTAGAVELSLPGVPPVVLDRRGPGTLVGSEWALTGKPSSCTVRPCRRPSWW